MIAQDALPTLPGDTGAWLVILTMIVSAISYVVKRRYDIQLEKAKAKIDTAENKIVRLERKLDTIAPPTKILYVEDNASDFQFMQHLFEFSGCAHPLVWERNADAGYVRMRDEDIEIVLVDMRMIGNGSHFLEIVKNDVRTRDKAVIVVSGSVPETIDIYKLGAIGYLPKPIQLSALLQTLSRHGYSWSLSLI